MAIDWALWVRSCIVGNICQVVKVFVCKEYCGWGLVVEGLADVAHWCAGFYDNLDIVVFDDVGVACVYSFDCFYLHEIIYQML